MGEREEKEEKGGREREPGETCLSLTWDSNGLQWNQSLAP